jgi:hypothetical protein
MTKLMKKLALILKLIPTVKWSLTKKMKINTKKKMNIKMNYEGWIIIRSKQKQPKPKCR